MPFSESVTLPQVYMHLTGVKHHGQSSRFTWPMNAHTSSICKAYEAPTLWFRSLGRSVLQLKESRQSCSSDLRFCGIKPKKGEPPMQGGEHHAMQGFKVCSMPLQNSSSAAVLTVDGLSSDKSWSPKVFTCQLNWGFNCDADKLDPGNLVANCWKTAQPESLYWGWNLILEEAVCFRHWL